jgi:predicted small secreted protein
MRVRRSHRVMAALAVTSAALAACNILTGLDADYASSAHDGAAAIGSEAGSDGPGTDGQGGMEASTNDGMVKPDADAGVTGYCRSLQDGAADADFFCTDFENESFPGNNQPPTGWTALDNLRDAGVFSLVQANGSVALDVTSSSDGSSGAHTRLKRVMAAGPTDAHQFLHYQLEYDFCVLASTLQYAGLGFLAFADTDTASKEHGIATYGPSAVVLSHQGGSAVSSKLSDTGVWHHAKVTLDRAAVDATYRRTITIDATNNVDDAPSGLVVASGDPTEIWLGIFLAATASGSAHLQFDNVVFWRTP